MLWCYYVRLSFFAQPIFDNLCLIAPDFPGLSSCIISTMSSGSFISKLSAPSYSARTKGDWSVKFQFRILKPYHCIWRASVAVCGRQSVCKFPSNNLDCFVWYESSRHFQFLHAVFKNLCSFFHRMRKCSFYPVSHPTRISWLDNSVLWQHRNASPGGEGEHDVFRVCVRQLSHVWKHEYSGNSFECQLKQYQTVTE